MTWTHPQDRVWSHTFTPAGREGGHQKQTTSSARRAPGVAVRTFTSTECTTVLLFTNTQQSFKFSSFIKRRRGGERGKKQKQKQTDEPNKKKKKKKNRTLKKINQINNTTVSLQRRQRVDRFTHGLRYVHQLQRWRRRGERFTLVFSLVRGAWPHPAPVCASAHVHTHPTHGHMRTHARLHAHPHAQTRLRAAGAGERVSPVRVLLYVIIRGGTIKEAGVEGLPLLPSGEDAGDGAESHLLFLLFPFLVFKIL